MSRWVLDCIECHEDFTHTEISTFDETLPLDPYLLWSCAKPEFPSGGLVLVCPKCKKVATYQRYELVFQFY
jgi:hypothetical protein